MQTVKSTTLFLSAILLTMVSCGQTTTKPTIPAAVKTTTTVVKTTTTTKTTQTIPTKTTAKKATTKTLQKSGTVKTTATTKTTTQKSQTGGTTQAKPITPVVKKAEPAVVIPNQQTQTTPPPAPQTTKVPTNTSTQTNTNTTPTPSTGGKVNPETGDNTRQQTNTNTGGKVVIGGGTDNTNNTNNNSIINTITEGDATSAIREALMKGVQVGVDKVSITDGYFGNSLIKIPFPSQVKQVESTLRNVGMGSLVDNAILSMNRAAESAAKQAGPIFLNSIKQMTVTDAVNIVSNKQPDAATQFLKRTTTESLVSSFKPSIKTALDKTLATKYWSDIVTYYNKIPFITPISTDLPDYVTRKAIDGLFIMVAQEEAKIRKDPGGQANEIIKTVFDKVKF